MEISDLNKRQSLDQNKRLSRKYSDFEILILELKKKEIPIEIIGTINEEIDQINSFSGSDKQLLKLLRNSIYRILKLIEKELKLVTKNHYRTTWMAIGMAAFGIPLGAAFGASLGNMAFIGIGIPIGMTIGMAIGAGMDKKAMNEGRQLDIEYKN